MMTTTMMIFFACIDLSKKKLLSVELRGYNFEHQKSL